MNKYVENAILKQVLNCDNKLKQVYSAYSIRLPRKKLITTIKKFSNMTKIFNHIQLVKSIKVA